ncbi:MAG: polysaccharide deacetylase family protein, partial [Vicinamibacterales bacterium]
MSLTHVLQQARTRFGDIRGAASWQALVILAYHGIRADESPMRNWMLLPQSRFATQVGELRERYDVLPLDEAVARLRAGALDRPTACITFDDGYENNLALALPVLRTHQAPATVFLATHFIGAADGLWTTALDAAFDEARAGSVDLSQFGLGVWPFHSIEEARTTGIAIKNRLKDLDVGRRDEVLESVRAQTPDPSPAYLAEFRFLDWDQVRELERSSLVSIGAHTVHHEILARLTSESMRSEIQDSIAKVATECSRPSRGFAYPNGRANDFDVRAEGILESAGCEFALTTIAGFNSTASPRFALRRLSIAGDCDLAGFRRLISR